MRRPRRPCRRACAGRDIFTAMKRSDPEGYAKVRAAADAVPNTGALLWRIEGKDQPPSYLFGTIHSTDERVTRLSPAVVAAFNAASTVALEFLESETPKSALEEMMVAKGFYANGSGLKDALTNRRTQHAAQDARRGGPSGKRDPSLAAMACGIHARASAL